jgi:hypothetical protein
MGNEANCQCDEVWQAVAADTGVLPLGCLFLRRLVKQCTIM